MDAGGADADGVKPILAKILKMPFLTDTDFIASTLWPNNPSLHPPILYGLFKDWDGKAPYDPVNATAGHRASAKGRHQPPPPTAALCNAVLRTGHAAYSHIC